eukprot:TRINITY_DN3247_c0_g1_i1.p1 TRINITY_DN3247_c0_g1~~TRINITY_DN3247_c0_g1_i1.p1  ORF type:complete len:301 (-),score=23.11 TRINITY_DN3247_c0_g1_i1:842-1744(-)
MATQFFSETFSSYSDLVSLGLASVAFLTNGMDPAHQLWGNSWLETFIQFSTMALLIFFTLFRFYLEVAFAVTAPREFLAISFVYSARWMYCLYSFHRSSALSGRLSRVAKSVRNIVTLRVGSSTHHNRRGAQEIVLRSGARKASGEEYWRGKIQREEAVGRGWLVHLVEEQMHTDLLSDLCTTEYTRIHKTNTDDLYRRLYQTIMNIEGADESLVDWTRFSNEYSPIAKTNFAVRAGATSDAELAGVARRVAADACLYVVGKRSYRTDVQVALINSCTEYAAREVADQLREESTTNNSRN